MKMKHISTNLCKIALAMGLALLVAVPARAWEKGDVNGDGVVNVSDVAMLVNTIINPSKAYPQVVIDIMDDMATVSTGVFTMGATWEQGKNYYANERPLHDVTLSAFSISKHEITQDVFQRFFAYNPSQFKGDNLPVENVSWNECKAFVDSLKALTGVDFRLPTESQWEFAARGGYMSEAYMYAAGDEIGSAAWYAGNSANTTHQVGTLAANEAGLYDMSGNVREWVYDNYGTYPDSAQTDPVGPVQGTQRVVRGGGWSSVAKDCRVSTRTSVSPDEKASDLGFRIVIGNEPETHGSLFRACDMNGDGNVNTSDITLLIKEIIGQ